MPLHRAAEGEKGDPSKCRPLDWKENAISVDVHYVKDGTITDVLDEGSKFFVFVSGGRGDDLLIGGAGNDRKHQRAKRGTGDDVLIGGWDEDTLRAIKEANGTFHTSCSDRSHNRNLARGGKGEPIFHIAYSDRESKSSNHTGLLIAP